ncbi:hypothetical protein DFH06DRAFT_1132083 [Mycena polygramma]|nr:hypothetical protein DFH06DRAFT_1132083 [Mycena polygramma]
MPLRSGPGALSISERIALRAAADPAVQKALDTPPTGNFFRTLAPPTVHGHDVVKNLWRGFAEQHIPPLALEIVPDTALPARDTLYEFAQYLSLGCKGLLAEYPQRKSIEKYVRNIFACWKRYAFLPAPDALTTAVFAYIQSPELAAIAPLTTKTREKPIPTHVDIEILIRAAYSDKLLFRTNRGRIQFVTIMLVSVQTSERPGAIMESDSYPDTNQAIFWGALTFLVFPNPNPEDALFPLVGILVDVELLKAWRMDESKRKSFFLWPEPLGNRALCPVTTILAMAEEDAVWEDVQRVRYLIHPTIAPTAVHKLTIKESCLKQPIFRADVLGPDGWTTSKTAALKARTNRQHTKQLCFMEGFTKGLTNYAFRRRAAKNLTSTVSDEDRATQMGQVVNTRMYGTAYKSTLGLLDLGAIFNQRESVPAVADAMEVASGVSLNRDRNAPQRLSVEQLDVVRNTPELVVMRNAGHERRAEANDAAEKLKLLESTSESDSELLTEERVVVDALRKTAAGVEAKYAAALNREVKAQIQVVRNEYFAGASRRQLHGQPAPTLPPLTTLARPDSSAPSVRGGKENANAPPTLPSLIDPHASLLDILYHFAIPDVHEEILACVDAILGLPERKFHPCYPGESPTVDGRCQTCNKLSSEYSVPLGEHVHDCYARDLRAQVQATAEQEFRDDPVSCEWFECTHHTPFKNRDKFIAHMQRHFDSPATHGMCAWWMPEIDDVCRENDCSDLRKHFAEDHDLNLRASVQVEYCDLCAQWFVDEAGDGRLWEEHSWGHFDEIASPYVIRPDGDVDLKPFGVVFVDGCVEFDHGTGFEGRQPELHGHIQYGVAMAPLLCPWCVFDTGIEMEERMIQWIKVSHFKKHLESHMLDFPVDGKTMCPVPSCGRQLFTEFELGTHIVAFHRLPLYGSTHHSVVRRLRLPSAPSAPAAAPFDLTHISDFNETRVETPLPLPFGSSSDAPLPALLQLSPMRKGHKRARDSDGPKQGKISGFCLGCRHYKGDIFDHLLNVPPGSKCRERSSYEEAPQNQRTKIAIAYTLPEGVDPAAPSNKSKYGRDHRCVACDTGFFDIRTHFEDANCTCLKTKFRIRDPGEKADTFGPIFQYEEWLPTALPLDVAGFLLKSKAPPKPTKDTPKNERCAGCQVEFVDVLGHFRSFKKTTNEECRKRRFSQRAGVGWGPVIEWATWVENPIVIERARMEGGASGVASASGSGSSNAQASGSNVTLDMLPWLDPQLR